MKAPYKKHYSKDQNIDEHRYIMQEHIGRKLERTEYVHHINGDKRDNRLENLMIISPLEHNRLHFEKLPKVKICKVCGKEFTPPVKHRKRNSICSRECWLVWQIKAKSVGKTDKMFLIGGYMANKKSMKINLALMTLNKYLKPIDT